ncbi:hypothetical protein G9E11_20535 [Arthrobacter sp. IA7]|uniref:hypothetical protein n=1 Tax=Arthrobacter ipis TaxID=2716202 RepID=UPI001683DD5D|nr:hypothetical protein [Arthrobacter ipis]MBD1544581.1 hypothetical protein [Arthrobacter ipis]
MTPGEDEGTEDNTVAFGAPRRVPKFVVGSDQPEMNRLQKSFHRRVFLPSLEADDPMNVQAARDRFVEDHSSDPSRWWHHTPSARMTRRSSGAYMGARSAGGRFGRLLDAVTS